MQLEANASALRLDFEMDPASLTRTTHHFARRTRLPLVVSRSLVLQALGLEAERFERALPMHDTCAD